MKKSILTLGLLSLFQLTSLTSNAQIIKHKERFLNDKAWKIGISYNMMDLNITSSNKNADAKIIHAGAPIKGYIAKGLGKGFWVEASVSGNRIEEGNYIDDYLLTKAQNILTADASVSYNFGDGLHLDYVDPYIKAGIGHYKLGANALTTASAGIGLNIYLADFGIGKNYRYPSEKWYSRFGINLEGVYRHIIDNSDTPGNHAQYSAGIFYRF